MRQNLILSFLIVFFVGSLRAQTNGNSKTGKISYISSQNIYVKFESTRDISIGDTLFMPKENSLVPALIVTNLSSTSCVCISVSSATLTLSSQVTAKNKIKEPVNKKEIVEIKKEKVQLPNDTAGYSSDNVTKQNELKQKITGSISAASYSNFSNTTAAASNRFQYNLSVNAMNIANSKFSAESYIAFRHEEKQWSQVQDNLFNALKIYSFSVKYDINKTTQISFGRKINYSVSNIGAIDGLQFEKKIRNFFVGAILGSRPNYTDYSFDFNLPQFGAYIGHSYKNTAGEMQNTFALVDQMNLMKTDRRFAYYQQSNSLLKNLYLFSSVEIDLYKKINDKAENTLTLSSTYLSLSYRIFKKWSLSTSYDSRKNVIYYETYKTFINQILETEARQGMSFQVSYNSMKNISAGIRTGYRFQNNNSETNKNLYGYVTYSNIPGIHITTTVAANYLETSYIKGKILNINISRDLFQGKLYADCGYQYIDYLYTGFVSSSIQDIGNISISWRFYNNLTLSLNFEETFEKQNRYSRLNVQIRKRF